MSIRFLRDLRCLNKGGQHDESWTRLDEIDGRDRRRAEIQGFVSNRLLKE